MQKPHIIFRDTDRFVNRFLLHTFEQNIVYILRSGRLVVGTHVVCIFFCSRGLVVHFPCFICETSFLHENQIFERLHLRVMPFFLDSLVRGVLFRGKKSRQRNNEAKPKNNQKWRRFKRNRPHLRRVQIKERGDVLSSIFKECHVFVVCFVVFFVIFLWCFCMFLWCFLMFLYVFGVFWCFFCVFGVFVVFFCSVFGGVFGGVLGSVFFRDSVVFSVVCSVCFCVFWCCTAGGALRPDLAPRRP